MTSGRWWRCLFLLCSFHTTEEWLLLDLRASALPSQQHHYVPRFVRRCSRLSYRSHSRQREPTHLSAVVVRVMKPYDAILTKFNLLIIVFRISYYKLITQLFNYYHIDWTPVGSPSSLTLRQMQAIRPSSAHTVTWGFWKVRNVYTSAVLCRRRDADSVRLFCC